MFNILLWCDQMISYLKCNNILFENGVAVLPKSSIYEGPVKMISTYKYRKDIPTDIKSESLICYYMFESDLFPRIRNMDKDISIINEYAGICGFDLSPSVGMLKPRQRFSILINSLFNCFYAVKGIKIMPNSRIGDFSTMKMTASIPDGVPFVVGMHGCNNYGFKNYGLYQLALTINSKIPPYIFIYGGLSKKDAIKLFKYSKRKDFKIYVFRDRRNRTQNGAQDYYYILCEGKIKKSFYPSLMKGGDGYGR